jgi:protein SCO1/2
MTVRTNREKRGRFGGKAGFAILLLVAAALFGPQAGEGFYKQEGTPGAKDGRPREEQNREYFTDRMVIAHDGGERRFYTDVLKDRVVLIGFFYTNCPTAGPDTAKLVEIRGMLDGDVGEKILFVSVSADPERDTLDAVKEYAKRHDPGKGWFLLTGGKENLTAINRKLGNASPDPESHIRIYLLGNLRTGHWIRMNQYAPSGAVADGLRLLAEE